MRHLHASPLWSWNLLCCVESQPLSTGTSSSRLAPHLLHLISHPNVVGDDHMFLCKWTSNNITVHLQHVICVVLIGIVLQLVGFAWFVYGLVLVVTRWTTVTNVETSPDFCDSHLYYTSFIVEVLSILVYALFCLVCRGPLQ